MVSMEVRCDIMETKAIKLEKMYFVTHISKRMRGIIRRKDWLG